MNNARFDERIVIVTGAGRGLGAAYAAFLSSRGAAVVVNDIDAAEAADVAGALPNAIVCAADVATVDGAARLIDVTIAAHGRIDAVIANAGTSWHLPFADATASDLVAVLDSSLFATWHVLHAAWPHFVARGYGRIVTTSSDAVFGFAGRAHYAAAKGAVLALTNTLAIEGAPHGIAANCVMPWGATRLARPGSKAPDPALAGPAVAWLCHADCTDNGAVFKVGGGKVTRVRFGPIP